MFKKMISAAANVFEVYDKNGNYLQDVTLVDCCHMGRNMQGVYHFLREEFGCTFKAKKELGDNGQGFVDESGHFHNRSDAFKIATSSGQPFNPEYTLSTNRLDSSCIRHFPEESNLYEYGKSNTFKYSLNQKVKVQVFNTITTGVIIKRQSYETNLGINFKYTLEYGEGAHEIVEAWEKDLDFVKGLPLGEME